MRFPRDIVLSVDINDPIGLFAQENGLIQLVRSKYQGRCYEGAFIDEIIEIISTSECEIHQHGDVGGTISVQCRIWAIDYIVGEIISAATIQMRVEKEVYMSGVDHCFIVISQRNDDIILKNVPDGLTIPIRVLSSMKSPLSTQISIKAEPWKPTKEVVIYRIMHELIEDQDASHLETIKTIYMAEEEEKTRQFKDNHEDKWIVLKQMVSAYPSGKKKLPTGARLVSLQEFEKIALTSTDIYFSRDPCIDLTEPNVVIYESAVGARNIVGTRAALSMYYSYISHLCMIREMAETYDTVEKFEQHGALWKIYNNIQNKS